jgi:dihydrofolate reductase
VIISMIVAMDEQRGIGHHGGLPWRLSTDMKRFKAITMGHHVIMGRKTYETIGRPLPGRTMIVITRNKAYEANGCLIAGSLDLTTVHAHVPADVFFPELDLKEWHEVHCEDVPAGEKDSFPTTFRILERK